MMKIFTFTLLTLTSCTLASATSLSGLGKRLERHAAATSAPAAGSFPAWDEAATAMWFYTASIDPAPLFSLGVIGDVQYADTPDVVSPCWTAADEDTRYYRNTLSILSKAVDAWNQEGLSMIVQMGDLLDARCKKCEGGRERALAQTLQILARARCQRRLDIIGNHELYLWNRDKLHEVLHTTGPTQTTWYSVVPGPGWRLLVLDSYEIATMGYPEADAHAQEARRILTANNPSWEDGEYPTPEWPDARKRFVPYNGGMSPSQLSWLEATLARAQAAGERVIVTTHVPLIVFPHALLQSVSWNAEEVLAVMHKFDCVRCCLYGHEHTGGYLQDEHGIHHIIVASPLLTPPGGECFASVHVHDKLLSFRGRGQGSWELAV